ncbi:MAG: hypothetical protein II816_00090 [Elusimicrobia bacterium]|nr:hypothetical protein [Elusimicrobiota bacterium]
MTIQFTTEVIIGIVLIAINVPVGWLGAALFGYYGQKTGKKIFYYLSALVYALSWGILALGVYLCGKDYAKYIIDNYVVKYIIPSVAIILLAIIVLMIVYRKKIFKNKGNSVD